MRHSVVLPAPFGPTSPTRWPPVICQERSWKRTWPPRRSEEHTSELQSHSDLVCRLLLEKKKEEETEARPPREMLTRPGGDESWADRWHRWAHSRHARRRQPNERRRHRRSVLGP